MELFKLALYSIAIILSLYWQMVGSSQSNCILRHLIGPDVPGGELALDTAGALSRLPARCAERFVRLFFLKPFFAHLVEQHGYRP